MKIDDTTVRVRNVRLKPNNEVDITLPGDWHVFCSIEDAPKIGDWIRVEFHTLDRRPPKYYDHVIDLDEERNRRRAG